MKKKYLFLLISLFLFNSITYGEFYIKNFSIGISYGLNYGLKHGGHNLYFPVYEHSRFNSSPNYRIILNNEISKRFDLNFSLSSFENKAKLEYPPKFYKKYNLEARIINYSLDIGMISYILKEKYFSFYFLGGISLNRILFDFIIPPTLHVNILCPSEVINESYYNTGIYYGIGLTFINYKIFSLSLEFSTRDVFIKEKTNNMGLFFDFVLYVKI